MKSDDEDMDISSNSDSESVKKSSKKKESPERNSRDASRSRSGSPRRHKSHKSHSRRRSRSRSPREHKKHHKHRHHRRRRSRSSNSRHRTKDRHEDKRHFTQAFTAAMDSARSKQKGAPGYEADTSGPSGSLTERLASNSSSAAGDIPKIYASSVNTSKMMEQIQKRKLLWSKKKETDSEDKSNVWKTGTILASKGNLNKAEKLQKLMGIQSGGESSNVGETISNEQKSLFQNLEREYEMSRMQTHTQRGAGLGFNSAASFAQFQHYANNPNLPPPPNCRQPP